MSERATTALLSKLLAAAKRVPEQRAPSGTTTIMTMRLADDWLSVVGSVVELCAGIGKAVLSSPDRPRSAARCVTLLDQANFCRTMQQALVTVLDPALKIDPDVDPREISMDNLMHNNAVVGRVVLKLLALLLVPLMVPGLPSNIEERRRSLISQITTSGIWAACITSIARRYYHYPAAAGDGADEARPFLVSEADFTGDDPADNKLVIPDDRDAAVVWSAMAAEEAAERHGQNAEQYAGQFATSWSSAQPPSTYSLSRLQPGPSWMVQALESLEVHSFLLARLLRCCVHLAGSRLHEEWGVQLLGLQLEQRVLGRGRDHAGRLREEQHMYMYELNSYANTFATLIPSWSRLPLPDALRLVAEVARCSLDFSSSSRSGTRSSGTAPATVRREKAHSTASSKQNVQQTIVESLGALRFLWDHLDDHRAELIPIQGAVTLKVLMSKIAQPCLMALQLHEPAPAYAPLRSQGSEARNLSATLLQSSLILLKRVLAPEHNCGIDAASGGEHARSRKAVIAELEGLPDVLESLIRHFVHNEPSFRHDERELLIIQLPNLATALRLCQLCVEEAPGLVPAGGPEVLSLASSLRKLLGCFSSDSSCVGQLHTWARQDSETAAARKPPRTERMLRMLMSQGGAVHFVLEAAQLAVGIARALFKRESAADAAARGGTIHDKLGMALSFGLLPACVAAASQLLPSPSPSSPSAGQPLDPGLVSICKQLPHIYNWILDSFWEVLGVASGCHLLLMQVSKAVALSESCSSGTGTDDDDWNMCLWNCRVGLQRLCAPMRPILPASGAPRPASWLDDTCHHDAAMYAQLLLSDLPAMAVLKELSSGSFLGPGQIMGPGGQELMRQAAAAVSELEAVRLVLQQRSGRGPEFPALLDLAAGYDVALLRLPENLRRAAGCANPKCQNAQGSSEAVVACKMCGKCGNRYCSPHCQKLAYPVHKLACAGQVQQYMDRLTAGREKAMVMPAHGLEEGKEMLVDRRALLGSMMTPGGVARVTVRQASVPDAPHRDRLAERSAEGA